MFLPASITGVHAKKQGEDLSDNDGDEDEGIFHGEQRWCMRFFFLRSVTLFCLILVWFLFANEIIIHPCHNMAQQFCLGSNVCVCLFVCMCE